MVSNFLVQAMRGEPLTVYGDGSQTRSLCYVDDEVQGLLALFDSALTGPVNIGNPDEHTVLELAHTVVDLLGSPSPIVHLPLPTDDPTRRRPDITLARAELGWEPTTGLREGLVATAAFLAAPGTSPAEAAGPAPAAASSRASEDHTSDRGPARAGTADRGG